MTESSGRTVALVSTQPLTEMSTRNIFWGYNGGWYLWLTNLLPSYVDYLEIWEPQTTGALRGCPHMYIIVLSLHLPQEVIYRIH